MEGEREGGISFQPFPRYKNRNLLHFIFSILVVSEATRMTSWCDEWEAKLNDEIPEEIQVFKSSLLRTLTRV